MCLGEVPVMARLRQSERQLLDSPAELREAMRTVEWCATQPLT
jgi:hypothetical protein